MIYGIAMWGLFAAVESPQHTLIPQSPLAALLVALGMVLGLWLWSRAASQEPRLVMVALGGLAGGLIGAKVGFWMCEAPIGWGESDWLLRMATGKTILGALLGGWIGVELSKRAVGRMEPTGDLFAAVIPFGIALGRVGCLLHGCCQGRVLASGNMLFGVFARWPAPWMEIAFQFAFLGCAWYLRKTRRLAGQHFHLYLIGYGAFRLLHEPMRATPRYPGTDWSPYALLAVICMVAGAVAMVRRA